MKQNLRHLRLYAFLNSSVLNALYIVGIISLLQIGFLGSFLLPLVCASASFALFIGYALWLWIKKPGKIMIDTRLSNQTIWFTLYFMAVAVMKDPGEWWYVIPLIAAILLLFVSLTRPTAKTLRINNP